MWLEPGTDKDARAAVEALTPAKSSGPKPTCRSFKLCSRSPARARRRQTWRCCWTRRASLYAGRSSVRCGTCVVSILSFFVPVSSTLRYPPTPPHPTPPSLPVAELVLHCNGGAASSPPSKPPPKQRRRENSEKSPHFSPEMEAAESELSTHDQLLALSQQMVRPPRPFALFDTPSLSHRQLTHATPQRSSPMPPHMVVADGRGGAVSTRRGHSDES